MEPLGVYRIFERSVEMRKLQYVNFFGDGDSKGYASVTDIYGHWCQHDVCYVNPETKGMVLKGRSDDVLIQKGERFGAADVYVAIHGMEEIQDYICVGQKKWNGDSRAVLFVKMRNGYAFNPEFKNKIANKIKKELWEDCVPELILEVQDIPFPCRNCGGGDRGGVAIYRPFGEFRRAKSYCHLTATAGTDVVQSGHSIFDDFFQHLWPYIGNNTANVVFQMVKRLWLIRIDQ
ncbi:acetoacetyl-CoA synthetase [Trichonephila clavipes]|nr:acetoacetyl-CoA synthetase [Trichonephila clavipes]